MISFFFFECLCLGLRIAQSINKLIVYSKFTFREKLNKYTTTSYDK